MLFAFEGPDEVGKTSLATALVERLRFHGVEAEYVALPGHVVGTLGQLVYELHHQPGYFGVHELDPLSMQLLHVASHVDQLQRAIIPALKRGTVVVLDRYWWSAPVYAEYLGTPAAVVDALAHLERTVWKDASARLVFLVRRGLPLSSAVTLDAFAALREIYDRFAAAENHDSVVHVSNERDLATALAAVEAKVREVIPITTSRRSR